MQILLVIVAGAVFLTLLGKGNPIEGVVTAINESTRGPRLTYAPADASGLVLDDPLELSVEAGYSLEVYALGRMLSSEEGRSDTTTQAAIVHATINQAAKSGKGIAALLLAAKNPRNRDHFGSQKDKDPNSANVGNSDRYASTALDPYDRDCRLVQQCMDGTIPDLTGGATNYDRPAGEANPEKVAANRRSAGLELVDVPGADPGLRFWA